MTVGLKRVRCHLDVDAVNFSVNSEAASCSFLSFRLFLDISDYFKENVHFY